MGIQINGQTDTITAIDGSITVGTDLSVPGVLTYEDVTNIDAIGIITARSGIVGDVTGNLTGNVTGNLTGNATGITTTQITVDDTFLKPHSVSIGTTTTAGRDAGISTATGTLIYNSDRESGQIYSGNAKGWVDFGKSQTFIFSETGYYTTSSDASGDDLYAYWNCNSTGTDKTLGSSGSATLYGVTSGTGWISNNWDRGTAYDNAINLTSMPTGNNWTLSFAFVMTDDTIHGISDGAGLLWLDSTVASSVILGYDGSTRVLRAGGNGWVSDGTVIINPLSTNTWYHIVVTKNNNDWKYYVNGVNKHNVTETMNNNGNWWFSNYSRHGGNTNNHYHRGRLDEIAIWERTLSSGEVTALYNAQSAGTPLYNP